MSNEHYPAYQIMFQYSKGKESINQNLLAARKMDKTLKSALRPNLKVLYLKLKLVKLILI